jgi:hypothetical protein
MTGMPISRRGFLSIVPASVALAACSGASEPPPEITDVPTPAPTPARSTVNVRDYGAAGDGIGDDATAIGTAVAALKPGNILYFPRGSYRFAQRDPPGTAAILIAGISDLDIDFDAGAELVMDNLDPVTGTGTSHGVLIRGPASRISLRNVKVRWASQPTSRSMGDGIRVVGYPADTTTAQNSWTGSGGPVNGVSISNCVIQSSPQAGAIMMGVSDIDIAGLRIQDTLADGLHFNACRRATIANYSATNTGDDGLALVTYYSEVFSFNNTAETFSFPDLTDWSDADFTITNVAVTGGQANGVRLAGANRVAITGLTVRENRSGSGVAVDSAAPGSDGRWYYVAARGLRLNQVTVEDCEGGIQVLARPNSAADERFTRFDLNVSEATIRNCANWSVRAESLTAQPATGLRLDNCRVEATSTTKGRGAVGLENTQGMSLGNVSLRHKQPVLAFTAVNSRQFTIDYLQVAFTGADEDPATAGPCAQFQASDGIVRAIDVNWPQAPTSWVPVRIKNGGDCSDFAPVEIGTLRVDPPSVTQPMKTC